MTLTNRLPAASPSAAVGAASPLAVMTDPLCVCVLDVLEDGTRAASQLVAEVSRRLGPSAGGPAFVASRVALLVASGFVEASEPPPGAAARAETVLSVAERRSCELLDALAEAVSEVRDAGDVQQEQDLVDALETAWAARDGRRSGLRGVDEFRASEAGRRHARRVAEGTLGQPGSPFAAGRVGSCRPSGVRLRTAPLRRAHGGVPRVPLDPDRAQRGAVAAPATSQPGSASRDV